MPGDDITPVINFGPSLARLVSFRLAAHPCASPSRRVLSLRSLGAR